MTTLAQKIGAVYQYLEQAMEPDGSNNDEILVKQYDHLIALVQRLESLDLEDTTACLKLLRSEACPFTSEQSKHVRQVIGSVGAPNVNSAPTTYGCRTYTKNQTHMYIHNYLNEKRWELVLQCDIDTIIDAIVDTCAEIGCLWPSPKPTYQWMVAFIHAAAGAAFTPDDAFQTLQKLRRLLHIKRMHAVPGAPSGIRTYVESSQEFASLYPSAFLQGPPVACKTDLQDIRNALSKVSLRATNVQLSTSQAGSKKSCPNTSLQMMQRHQHQQEAQWGAMNPQSMAQGMAMIFSQMMNNQH